MKSLSFALFIFLLFAHDVRAQIPTGLYVDTGYFFQFNASRNINMVKNLNQLSANHYKLELGDLGNQAYWFTFDVDANNKLVNWSAVQNTPAAPASNFMTQDDPGDFFSALTPAPGTSPYVQSLYNNTYDPVTNTFYFHYGYGVGSFNQNGFSRQVYEKLTYIKHPKIQSVTPMTGTAFTQVTIKGEGFAGINPASGINFGAAKSDSAVVVSDSVITAWVGGGGSGLIRVLDQYYNDTVSGFVYTPVAPITNTAPWEYLGNAGFSQSRAYSVNATLNKNNEPYVIFIDSSDGRARVMKYNGVSWVGVGDAVSEVKCSNTKIGLDTAGNPIVAYVDSTTSGYLVIKKFNGTNWINLNMPQPYRVDYFSLALDKLNNVYVPFIGMNDTTIVMYQYNGSGWSTTNVGSSPFSGFDLSITISRDNTPYLLYVDNSLPANRNRLSVKKSSGANWVYVGTPGFTDIINGIYYPAITTDTSGKPVVTFVEDNGFERLSAYNFNGTDWSSAKGKFFSKSRSSFVSFAIDSSNKPLVAFIDGSYNGRGTVLTLNATQGTWDTVGHRGFLSCQSLEGNAMLVDKTNSSLIAFSDISQNGRLSVMKLKKYFTWTGTVSTAWENPANWDTGIVPSVSSDVFINAGAVVILSSNVMVNSVTVNPSASFTILPNYSLTIIGH